MILKQNLQQNTGLKKANHNFFNINYYMKKKRDCFEFGDQHNLHAQQKESLRLIKSLQNISATEEQPRSQYQSNEQIQKQYKIQKKLLPKSQLLSPQNSSIVNKILAQILTNKSTMQTQNQLQ